MRRAMLSVMLAGIATWAHADVCPPTYLDPNWQFSNHGIVPLDAGEFDFDSSCDVYLADSAAAPSDGQGGGLRTIWRYTSASGYASGAPYLSYHTELGSFVSGVQFNADRTQLYVSEVDQGGDSGSVVIVDVGSSTVVRRIDLPDFRSSGIELDQAGNVYLTARLVSQPTFGPVFLLPDSYALNTFGLGVAPIGLFAARGIERRMNTLYLSTHR